MARALTSFETSASWLNEIVLAAVLRCDMTRP